MIVTRGRRGQNMVLFALTLMLLTLMVCVTLQVGMRAKEKVEAQMVADAAAYSEAVQTARTYNMTAIMNRGMAAHYVALLGTEALVSWSGMIRGSAPAVAAAFSACGAGGAAAALLASAAAGNPAWEVADDDAGDQARDHQRGSGRMDGAVGTYFYDELLGRQIGGQQLAGRIARRASPDLTAPMAGDTKSTAEILESVGGSPGFLSVIMGSRGWVFTTDRAAATTAGRQGLALSPVVNTNSGGTGFGDDPWFGTVQPGVPAERSQFLETMRGEGAWAEDHGGNVTIQIGGCTAAANVSSAFVMSSALEVLTDKHAYAMLDVGRPESVRHTLLSCPPAIPGCPGVVGSPMAFNNALIGDDANDHGQPTLYTLIERDYAAARADPWALLFNFQFTRAGPGSMFDNGNPNGTLMTPAGASLRKQIAVGAGLVYYHRPTIGAGGGFIEPPNLWNPFWRATLGPPDRDVGTHLGLAGYPEAQAVVDQLLLRGYRGIP
jgi:hypothetical protein